MTLRAAISDNKGALVQSLLIVACQPPIHAIGVPVVLVEWAADARNCQALLVVPLALRRSGRPPLRPIRHRRPRRAAPRSPLPTPFQCRRQSA